jgi:hypothetical protein
VNAQAPQSSFAAPIMGKPGSLSISHTRTFVTCTSWMHVVASRSAIAAFRQKSGSHFSSPRDAAGTRTRIDASQHAATFR